MQTPWTRVRSGVLVVVGLVAVVGPVPAGADDRAATLQRAAGNIVGGAGDVVLTPVVSSRTLWDQGKAAGYKAPAMASLGLFGTAWMAPLNLATGLFRAWSGMIEVPIGLVELVTKSFTSWQPPPLFDVERDQAMVNYDNPVVPVKTGVYYFQSGTGG